MSVAPRDLDQLFDRVKPRIDRHEDGSTELLLVCDGPGIDFRYRWDADGHYVGYDGESRE